MNLLTHLNHVLDKKFNSKIRFYKKMFRKATKKQNIFSYRNRLEVVISLEYSLDIDITPSHKDSYLM